LSSSRIVASLPVDVTGDGISELVFMNINGEIFSVEPITNPLSLMKPLVATNFVDNNNWNVITYLDSIYEQVSAIQEVVEEIQKEHEWKTVPIEIFVLFGIGGGIFITLFGIIIRKKKIIPKFLRQHPGSDIVVGGDN
jgi:hypothetical protein